MKVSRNIPVCKDKSKTYLKISLNSPKQFLATLNVMSSTPVPCLSLPRADEVNGCYSNYRNIALVSNFKLEKPRFYLSLSEATLRNLHKDEIIA